MYCRLINVLTNILFKAFSYTKARHLSPNETFVCFSVIIIMVFYLLQFLAVMQKIYFFSDIWNKFALFLVIFGSNLYNFWCKFSIIINELMQEPNPLMVLFV